MLLNLVLFTAAAVASPTPYNSRPYADVAKRQASYGDNLQVDLGYSIYQVRGFEFFNFNSLNLC